MFDNFLVIHGTPLTVYTVPFFTIAETYVANNGRSMQDSSRTLAE